MPGARCRRSWRQLAVWTVTLGVLCGGGWAESLTIDNFSEGDQALAHNVSGSSVVNALAGLSPANTIGGSRELVLTVVTTPAPTRDASTAVEASFGDLIFNNDVEVDGILRLRWDGVANNAADGALGADLSLESALVFQNLVMDRQSVYVEVQVCNPANTVCAVQSFHLDRTAGPGAVGPNVPRTYTQPLNFGAFDLTHVGALSVAFRTGAYNSLTEPSLNPVTPESAALDLSLESLETVRCTGTIGNYTWLDSDGNGQQDLDPALPGVQLTLDGVDAFGRPVHRGPIVSNTQGLYQFQYVCAGTYTVTAVIPANTTPTLANTGADTTDSDGVVTSPTTVAATVTLADNETNDTIDFGFVPHCTGALGNFVWLDEDSDGQQDPLEPGLPNVPVTLAGTDVFGRPVSQGPINTDSQGHYRFENVCAGTYTVTVAIPENTAPTLASPNTGPADTDTDSDGVQTTPTTVAATVSLVDGEINDKIDFGFIPDCTSALGNFVWLDEDGNGQQGPTEPGLPNVQVQLSGTDIFGRPVNRGPVFTNTQGLYQFNNLCAGTYTVTVTDPANTTPTTASPETGPADTDTDSDGVVVSPTTVAATVVLADDQINNKIDFGFVPHCTGKIGDFAWRDLNGNGSQDGGEPGIGGVQVSLSGTDVFGRPVTTLIPILTDGQGKYQFSNVCAGTYTVTVKNPADSTPTNPNVGPDTIDSDGVPASATTVAATLTLADNETNLTIDFGYLPPVTADCVTITAVQGFPITPVTLTGSGGSGGPYTFTATGLPAGLTLSSNGTLSGTPTVNGIFTYIVTVTDNTGHSSSKTCSVPVLPPPSVNCVTITAVQGFPITPVTLTGSGGSGGPYTFTATGLPAGLTLSASGTLSGTPAVSGSFDYTVTVTDNTGHSRSKPCNVPVLPPPSVNCVTITAVQGFPITPVTLTGSGGSGGPYTFAATGLPAGLTLSASGTLSGTPTVSGTFPYIVTVTDNTGHSSSKNCTVAVSTAPSVNCVTVTAVQGFPITPVTLTGSGGSGSPYTFAATGLPAGLTLSSSGTLSGTPTVNGIFTYTVTVTDSTGHSSSKSCTITVTTPPSPACVPSTFAFSGNTATSGTLGNTRTFTVNGISVKASAFSRTDGAAGVWQTAYLGLYGPGMGVTDSSEGTGANNQHKVDNMGGRNNYVLFEFSTPVLVNRVFLDSIGADSDLAVWIGTKADPFNNHLTLSDALLSSLGFTEENWTSAVVTSRWADINAGGVVGNVLVVAAVTTDTTPEDAFKISKLDVQCAPTPPPPCVASTFAFSGNTATSGTLGNTRTFTVNGISVKASAFSRVDGANGAWATAYLGLYGPGMGVTDSSEGTGANNLHKVDNMGGRNNYVLFEFSTPVVLNRVFLDSIGADSDLALWIGTKPDPFNNHLTLSDTLLSSLGFTEESWTSAVVTSRWADVNAGGVSGNVIVIAAVTSDASPEDAFKISKLETQCK